VNPPDLPSNPAGTRRALLSLLAAAVWAALIFFSSSVPGDRLPSLGALNADKLAHLGVYAVLAALIDRALRAQVRFPFLSRRHLMFTVLLTGLYGVTDEFHQAFVPGRNAAIFDLFADILGALLYAGAYRMRGARRSGNTDI